jgi:hypothetical protein
MSDLLRGNRKGSRGSSQPLSVSGKCRIRASDLFGTVDRGGHESDALRIVWRRLFLYGQPAF